MSKLSFLPILTVATDGIAPSVAFRRSEAAVGGTIALVQEGDSITIDAHRQLIRLDVEERELALRKAGWTPPTPRYTRGVLAKYARLVGSASRGAVTD